MTSKNNPARRAGATNEKEHDGKKIKPVLYVGSFVCHGRFVAVGSSDDIRNLVGSGTDVIDAEGMTVTGHDNPSPIHCFACHAPHSNSDFRLRWTSVATLQNGESFDLGDGNLCVACHQEQGGFGR